MTGKHNILSYETGLTSTQYKHYFVFDQLIGILAEDCYKRGFDSLTFLEFKTIRKVLVFKVKMGLWGYNKLILKKPDKTPERQAVTTCLDYLMLNALIEESETDHVDSKTEYTLNINKIREEYQKLKIILKEFQKGNNIHTQPLMKFNSSSTNPNSKSELQITQDILTTQK